MLTREEILARKTGKGEATLPDGSKVGVRALTRDEVLEMNKIQDLRDRDNFIVATGMVQPQLTAAEVAAWGAEGNAGDLVAITDRIAELSGLKKESPKRSV